MGSHKIWDLGLNGPNMDIWDRDGIIWGSGMNGVLWDVGFGVGWPLKWRYGAQGWMGPYEIWDLGSGGPNVDIWDWDEVMEDMGMNVIP